jgi:hypothetical protein
MAYYKGTTVPFPAEMDEFKMFQKGSKDCVELLMREGYSLTQIKGHYLDELNELEEKLCECQRKHPERATGVFSTMKDWLSQAWGSEWPRFYITWYINIDFLLKTKVIPNDEMNGWLVMERPTKAKISAKASVKPEPKPMPKPKPVLNYVEVAPVDPRPVLNYAEVCPVDPEPEVKPAPKAESKSELNYCEVLHPADCDCRPCKDALKASGLMDGDGAMLCHDCHKIHPGQECEEESFEDWAKTTIVTKIVCRRCGNELPPMTAEAHLEGWFNQTCPHK